MQTDEQAADQPERSPIAAVERDNPGPTAQRLIDRVGAELAARLAAPLKPGLYLVATPIGNLADVTLRALIVLATASEIYCEDTRQSQKLLGRYGIERRLGTYHEHNAERERPRMLRRLAAGDAVALISDAGMPLISDPGYKLVEAAITDGHAVVCIPGASATLTALAVSGLPTDQFQFAGFLPAKPVARRKRIEDLMGCPGTLILFESPSRLTETLDDFAAIAGHRPAVVARELTKLHEEIARGTLAELAVWAKTATIKGEIVLLVGQGLAVEVTDPEIEAALTALLPGHSVRDAAQMVALRLGVSRTRVYDLAVVMKRNIQGPS